MNSFYVLVKTLLLVFFLCLPFSADSKTLSESDDLLLVNDRLLLLLDTQNSLTPEQAFNTYKENRFAQNSRNQVSFGFTKNTVWGVLPITNSATDSSIQVLKIDNAWLDEIDIYFFKNDQLRRHVALGDSLLFTQRPRDERMPAVAHSFEAGETFVLFRFQSEDPMTIPIYLGNEGAIASYKSENAYFYGALYGSLLILLIYNFVLYFYLKERRYLLYSLYLFAFTAFNFTYTGHGFWVAWSDSIWLQQWVMPTLMFCYIFSGVVFTIEFLNTRVFLPALYSARRKIYFGLLILACVIFLTGSRSVIVMVQLMILTTMSIWMLVIGYFSYKGGNPLAKFFIPAIAMGTGGATISSLATWGVIPYSQWAFRGIEIGMLIEMSLLSISLGFNFKMVQEARKSAETNARLDPLTNLYNRRAFPDLVHPIWLLGKRNKNPMSIILMDLDWFKRINDQFGHTVGDEVLERVSMELKKRLRDSDIPLRWGGEEFLIFLPNTEGGKAKHLAESLRKHFETLSFNKVNKITTSIGVASAFPSQIDLDKLIMRADEALYSAKQKGRNQVVAV